ncbi:MAG: hypothetical protein L3J05_02425, partial [Robiginitomaculum sp.]|nr:hypothetical protein [Robiginitomaculum sp.]
MHFDTIADMQVNHTPQSGITDLLGYHAIGDGGGGRFIWDTSFSSGDITYDAFHGIHVPVDGDPEDENGKKGVYVRVGYDTLDIRYFGAIEDEDITARLQSALDLSSDSLGSPPTPLGSSTSILNTGAGNTIIIPWPKSPYLLSSTSEAPNFIEIPNHIVLKGIGGPSGAPTGVTNIGWQFEYYGDDAAFRNKVGHADEGQSQGIFIDNIGVKIIADGATGFRFWRARDCGMSRCVSRLSNSNQTGFHFKGERGLAPDGVTLGSFTGVYDCLFERLTSSVLGVKDKTSVHFKVSGEFNNGQVNSCAFNKLRSSGRGTGLQMQAGFANVFTGFDAE